MISNRDGHVRVLPLLVANKIAAGEVVERPASVAKELVENALDAGATRITLTIAQGGRKLVSVQDDGCGMSKDDAVLSLERQATSKIRDVTDIEEIDTLGFRGEAIPSIASVSRFSMTTRRADSDEGIFLQVNAGTLAEIRAAGCPAGTLVEVRDLFCNVPARRKFLRAYATEEGHVKNVFTTHALAHPSVGFTLIVDGRETYRLSPASSLKDRVRDLFGDDYLGQMLTLDTTSVSGMIEKPNLASPTRREQYVFINGRPASAPVISATLREVYPHRVGEARPAAILFFNLPPNQIDVNVHPTKREVRFRDTRTVRLALEEAVTQALGTVSTDPVRVQPAVASAPLPEHPAMNDQPAPSEPTPLTFVTRPQTFVPPLTPAPVQHEIVFAAEPDAPQTKPWQWFKVLAQSASGYLLIETDSGIVTINPQAARERIAYEKLITAAKQPENRPSQALLIPETVKLGPVDAARITSALETITQMGFQIEPFGTDTFKVDSVPQIIGSLSPAAILTTIAHDLSENGARRNGERWRDELIAKSIAKTFSGAPLALTPDAAERLVTDLCACRMPYICPRGKPVMIFTSTRELDRKFNR